MNIEECEKLFSKSIESLSEAEFYYSVEPLFNEYDILSLEFGRGSIFWRARKIESDVYPNIEDLDYPPSEYTDPGRLNDKGEPFFYISVDMETALAEVNPDDGQLVQLAGFKIKNESPLKVAVVGEYSNVQKNGYMHFLGRDPDKAILKMLNQLDRKEALKKIYIDRFFAHILRDPKASDNNYQFSRSLTKAILGKSHADGIVFPSVKDRGGFNIGVKSKQSDKCFHNVSCAIVKVHSKRKFGLIDYEIVNSATHLDKDDDFLWPDKYIPESISQYNMTKDELEKKMNEPFGTVYFSGKVTD